MQEHRSVQGSFDLHTHSVYSDGSQSVQALIAEARERGLSGIAITDHDSLRQLSSVRAEARKMGFPVIAGVEASCIDSETGRKIHILCYGLAATADESGPLELLVNETLARRTANTLWQAWTLERKGMAPAGEKHRWPTWSKSRGQVLVSTNSMSCRRLRGWAIEMANISAFIVGYLKMAVLPSATFPIPTHLQLFGLLANREACPCSHIPSRWTRGGLSPNLLRQV